MTTKPRVPLGKRPPTVDVVDKLVAVRRRTLALAALGPIAKLPLKELGLDLSLDELKSNSTAFERLSCVGLTPSMDQLTAVVEVRANSGYSGPLCADGSTEHVRFYVSTDDGASWTDAGADAFAVHDTPGARPLAFAVNVVNPMRHTFCWIENHVLVRAILSWNVAPPPNDPHHHPVWGDVLDVRVRPRTRRFPTFLDLVHAKAITVDKSLLHLIDPTSPIAMTVKPALPVGELAALYRADGDARPAVAPHRFAFPAYLAATASVSVGAQASASVSPPIGTFGTVLDQIGVKLPDFIGTLFKTDGNTDFEELGCVGYDPVEDALVGVFTVKRANGYSGGPCTAGSTEHVAFWVDWGSGWEYVGTTATTVHDESVPDGGLHFSVYHPLNSYAHRRACSDGPVQPKVRAILSWEQAPPPGNPDWVPTWGNREERTIELPAGAVTPLAPVLESVSGYAACQIDPSTGLTIAHDRPFGGTVSIAGFIPGAPDLGSPAMKYRLTAQRLDSAGNVVETQTLRDSFSVWVTESIGGAIPTQHSVLQEADDDGWFTYLADPNPSGAGWRQVVGNKLYSWYSKPRTGRWEIELRAKDAGGVEYAAQVLTCPDSSTRQQVRLFLDQAQPVPHVAITRFQTPGNPSWTTATNCLKFPVGAILGGTFSATDEHFHHIVLRVEGADYESTTPVGGPRWTIFGDTSYPGAPTTGTSGTWEFDTAGMTPCGYIVRATAVDRTVNGGGGWSDDDEAGFSLE